MKIKDVVCAAGSTGFYFDDQRAIKRGAGHDGMFYIGQPVTEGFSAVRMKGEAVSVMIVLEDGQIAFGDCAAVQYSGAGGRDPLFLAKDFIPIIEQYVRPMLLGREADDFRGLCAQMEAIEVNGKRLHTAIRYGVSQAILDAVAKATGRLMCEVVADEYGCTVSQTPIPIFTQSGDDRYDNADKMIIKRAQVLPHALINNVQTKLGEHGEKLLEYVKWLRDRILTMRADESYQPVLHIDVYGTIGAAFGNNNYAAMADYLAELEQAAKPFHLRIEGPMDCDCDRETQIVALAGLTAELDRRGIQVELVADEWCNTLEDIREFADRRAGHMVQIKTPDLGGINNTIEAVLYCKAHGIGAYQGGTCNETDRSAQVCVHCAMATQPVQILAKPGINTVADLKGKTVCVGDVGSGTEINAWQVLGAAGLTKDDVNAVNGSFQDGVDQLKDGKIDAAFTVAGAPTTAIVDYATTNTLNLVSLTDEELAAIQEAYPFLIRDDLPSTTYTGMTGDVVCVAIQATLVASKDLSEDVVYEFVKAMFDNKDALTEGHAKFGFLDPETASAGATVTMHPGAEKYYKEIGVL